MEEGILFGDEDFVRDVCRLVCGADSGGVVTPEVNDSARLACDIGRERLTGDILGDASDGAFG